MEGAAPAKAASCHGPNVSQLRARDLAFHFVGASDLELVVPAFQVFVEALPAFDGLGHGVFLPSLK